MATIRIRNTTSEAIFLRDFYFTIAAGDTVTLSAFMVDLSKMSGLQERITAGDIVVDEYTVPESESWFLRSAGGGSGWVIITDITPQGDGVVSDKTYEDPPANTVLQSCTSSTSDVNVLVIASSAKVKVGTVEGILSPSPDGDAYHGTVAVTLGASGDLVAVVYTPDGQPGSTDSVTVTLDAPPELLSLQFTGDYPGVQTELKAGDTFQIIGTTDKACTGIQVQNFGAGTLQDISFASTTNFTATITIANRGDIAQLLPAKVKAKNAAGALGPERSTNTGGGSTEKVHVVNLNNLHPTVTFGAITYPDSQLAIKSTESATIAVTTANLDSILFTSPTGELTITNPTVIESPKTAAYLSGTYNIATTNFRAVATRNANAATTTTNGVIGIADAYPTISASLPATRLRSGGNDGTSVQNHTITLTSDQALLISPSMNAETGGGTFTGVWTGGPTVWTRTLQVSDGMSKGSYTWTVPGGPIGDETVIATNLANRVTWYLTGSADYVLGGFVSRNLTFAAFSQTTTMNVSVTDYSKLVAGTFTATNQAATRMTTINDLSNAVNQFTVTAAGVNPTTLFWNDQAAAASNSSGTAQILAVQETV